MKKEVDLRFLFSVLLLLIVSSIMIYLLFFSKSDSSSTDASAKGFLHHVKDPEVLAVFIGLILTYLIIDRWKNIESRLDKIRDDQNISIKEIESLAVKKIDEKVEKIVSRAETIDQKVKNLIDNHPWIGLMNESDIIPDIPTCSVVLQTCNKILKMEGGKRSIVQEYIYYWVGKRANHQNIGDAKNVQLEGTPHEFLDLSDFCEDVLKDDYLSFLVIQSGYNFNYILSPYYLRKLLRFGHIKQSSKIVLILKSTIQPNLFSKLVAIYYGRYFSNADYQCRCLALIGLYESLRGRISKAEYFLKQAYACVNNQNSLDYVICTLADVYYNNGQYDKALEVLNKINIKSASKEISKYSKDIENEIAANLKNVKKNNEAEKNNPTKEKAENDSKKGNNVVDFDKKTLDPELFTITNENTKIKQLKKTITK